MKNVNLKFVRCEPSAVFKGAWDCTEYIGVLLQVMDTVELLDIVGAAVEGVAILIKNRIHALKNILIQKS